MNADARRRSPSSAPEAGMIGAAAMALEESA